MCSSALDMERYNIIWSPEAVEAVAAIHSDRVRNRILHRVGLLDQGSGLHRPRPTASWGTVCLMTERPFVVVYRYRDASCEILDVVDATFMASYEVRE